MPLGFPNIITEEPWFSFLLFALASRIGGLLRGKLALAPGEVFSRRPHHSDRARIARGRQGLARDARHQLAPGDQIIANRPSHLALVGPLLGLLSRLPFPLLLGLVLLGTLTPLPP